jgi:hypothetical protein
MDSEDTEMKLHSRFDRDRAAASRVHFERARVKAMSLRGRREGTAQAMLLGAVVASWFRGGGRVRVQGIVPGVSVSIEAPLGGRPTDVGEIDEVVSALWDVIWPQLRDWCMIDPLPQEAVCLVVQDVVIRCGWDQYVSWLPGAMDIVIKDDSATPGADAAREWVLKSRWFPRNPRPTPMTERAVPTSADLGRTPVEEAIGHALQCLQRASAPEFISLPPPVGYRATGALDAWQAVWRATGRDGAQFAAHLRDPRYAPLVMSAALPQFIEAHSRLDLRSSDDGQLAAMLATMNCLHERCGPPARATVQRNMRADRTESCGRRPLARDARGEP